MLFRDVGRGVSLDQFGKKIRAKVGNSLARLDGHAHTVAEGYENSRFTTPSVAAGIMDGVDDQWLIARGGSAYAVMHADLHVRGR